MAGDGLTVDSDMSTSINSDASLDIDIVRHHDGRNLPLREGFKDSSSID